MRFKEFLTIFQNGVTSVKTLFEYQQLEVAERGIIAERDTSHEFMEMRRIKSEFIVNKQRYLQLINDIAALTAMVKNFPQQLAMQQEKIEAEQSATYDGSVSSMKALSAREAQLAALEEKLAHLEEEKTLRKEELLQKQAEVTALKEIMDQQYQDFLAVKQLYLSEQSKREQLLSGLTVAKSDMEQRISAEELAWFNEQKERFQGSPLAKLDANHVCSGCHTMVTPICYKRVMQGMSSTCENCGRTLFIDEES